MHRFAGDGWLPPGFCRPRSEDVVSLRLRRLCPGVIAPCSASVIVHDATYRMASTRPAVVVPQRRPSLLEALTPLDDVPPQPPYHRPRRPA